MLGGSTRPGKELGVLEHQRVGDQVVVLCNEVENVVAVT